ncbi:MAG: iron-sulfur cluster assembly scaffold protein [Candidatus Pacearchaeota archaeon]|nr:iron-sulfur cluster assembly scaffold protein [Candidatus Pacearchaeota archaeon]
MEQYNKKVMQHFLKPKNVGEIKNPDGVGKVGNLVCGDIMHVFIKVKEIKGKDTIYQIKFQTLGCAAAVATSDVVIDLAKGKTIQDALKITNQDVVRELGGLPAIKVHCSLLAEQALSEAIYDYMIKKGKKVPKELEEKHKRNQEHEKNFHDKFKCEK